MWLCGFPSYRWDRVLPCWVAQHLGLHGRGAAGVLPGRSLRRRRLRGALLVLLQHRDVGRQAVVFQDGEGGALPHDGYAAVGGRQVAVAQAGAQRLQRLLHQRVQAHGGEALKLALQVGLGGLGARADGDGVVLVVVAGGAGLEHVRPARVVARHQQAHAVRPLPGALRAHLRLVRDLPHEAADGQRGLVHKAVVDALVAHVARQDAPVRGQPRDGDAHVVVHLEDLLLVAGQLARRALERGQHHVRLAAQAHCGASLLHRLHGILDLVEPPRRAPRGHICVVLVAEHGGGRGWLLGRNRG
mmetsp:Transcript_31559/g.79823  ORF Transcript_31559/g.79823 Transcript_31559/m.79823 type:complete len:301 (+) Transcript_31559:309-1211(+)